MTEKTSLPKAEIHEVLRLGCCEWEQAENLLKRELDNTTSVGNHRYLFTADQMHEYEEAGYRRGLKESATLTREEIIKIAKEAGFNASIGKTDRSGNYTPWTNALSKDVPIEWIEKFLELIGKD